MRELATVTVLLVALGTSCSSDVKNPCSAQDVLNALTAMLRTGNTEDLDAITLRFSDLDSNLDNAEAAAEFDAALVASNRADIKKVVQRYGALRVRAVKLGTTELGVHLEGTEYFVDRIRNSVVTVDPSGAEIIVASLVRGRGCWRLENFGLGVRGLEPPPEAVRSSEAPTARPSRFHLFTDSDYCTGVTIYRSPSHHAEIGTLIEGYRYYRDPNSGRVFEAILLQSLATGHVRGIWMSRDQLAATYVDDADRALQKCTWSTREEEASPLTDETPAALPRKEE